MSTLNKCNGGCATILTGMREKFDRDELTDVEIRYGQNGQFSKKAHRVVLCSASKFFDNMLNKHDFVEKTNGVIYLDIIEHKEVGEALLTCMYSAGYNDTGRAHSELFFNILVYAAANYTGLHYVRSLAAQKFSVAATQLLSMTNDCGLLIAALKNAYKNTATDDKMLRPMIAKLCVDHKKKLFADPKFKAALRDYAELSTDINFMFANVPELQTARSNDPYISCGVAPMMGRPQWSLVG